MSELVRQRLLESAEVLTGLLKEQKKIEALAHDLVACLQRGNKILICGNGGSAADSQHFAAELVGRLQRDRSPLPGLALSTDTSVLTAIGNDYGFDQVFAKQVEALGQPGDILIGLSTSGNSANVLAAMAVAAKKQMKTIVLSGKGGGAMAQQADDGLVIASATSQHVQEGHIAIIHIWCEIIENTLFPEGGTPLR